MNNSMKCFNVFCNIDTGLDVEKYLIATFFNEKAVQDYVSTLCAGETIFVSYDYEEDIL